MPEEGRRRSAVATTHPNEASVLSSFAPAGDFNRFAETLCARPADTGPVLDDHGSSGAHLWVCRTVVLDKRAAAAAISAESWSFDQLRQVCALWRQPHSDWSGGSSAHSRPCSEGLSYGDNDSCRRAPEFVLDKLSVAESWWSGPELPMFRLMECKREGTRGGG